MGEEGGSLEKKADMPGAAAGGTAADRLRPDGTRRSGSGDGDVSFNST